MELVAQVNSAAIALLLTMAASIATVRSKVAFLVSALLVLMAAYLSIYAIGLGSTYSSVIFILSRLSTLIPAVLWLIAVHLFRDGEKIPVYVWPIIWAYVLTRGLGMALLHLNVISFTLTNYALFIILPQIAMIGFACHAIYITIQGYNADLIENRRNLRIYFVIAASILTILTRFEAWTLYYGMYRGLELDSISRGLWGTLATTFALVFSASFFIWGFRVNASLMPLFDNRCPKLPFVDVRKHRLLRSDRHLVTKIRSVIEEEKRYQEAGLTIDVLANELGIHKDKLRKTITNYFGSKNFNQFLNLHRLEQVAQDLRRTDEPISTIAYNAGFASLSVFNTLFKSNFGVTPSKYRSQKFVPTEFNDSEGEMIQRGSVR